jgi:hypothetical protein
VCFVSSRSDGDGEISAEEFVNGLASADTDPSLEDLLMPHQAPESVFDSLRKNELGAALPNIEDRAITLRQLKEIYLTQVRMPCPDPSLAPILLRGAWCTLRSELVMTGHASSSSHQPLPMCVQVVRRCSAETWIGRRQDADGKWEISYLTAETVDFYDLASYVIVPATSSTRCSLMELVAGVEHVDGPATVPPSEQAVDEGAEDAEGKAEDSEGKPDDSESKAEDSESKAEDPKGKASGAQLVAQRPDWVVSHGWRLPVQKLIHCLEAHARDVGLGDDAKYWIASFSNRQAELTDGVTKDPTDNFFYRAMKAANGALSVVDEAGECFTRTWCDYEAFLAVHMPPYPAFRYAIYTPVAHEYRESDEAHAFTEMRMAVGLLDGRARDVSPARAASEVGGQPLLESITAKFQREKAFPKYLFDFGTTARSVESGETGRPTDKGRLLNSIVFADPATSEMVNLKGKAPPRHPAYAFVDERLQGRFAAYKLFEHLANITAETTVPVVAEKGGDKSRKKRRSKDAEAPPEEAMASAPAADDAPLGVAAAAAATADEAASFEGGPSGTPAQRCLAAVRRGKLPRLDVSFAMVAPGDRRAVVQLLNACDLSTLTELWLTECVQIHALPIRLLELTNLTVLSLQGATNLGLRPEEAAEEIAPGILPPNPNALPAIAASLPNLRELDLSGCCNLERLPDDVSDLPELVTLRLAGCTSIVQLPANLGGSLDEEPSKADAAPAAEADAAEDADDGPTFVDVPRQRKLAYLDLSNCERLLQLPDMSKLGEQLEVNLDGVKIELCAAWQRAGRGAVSAAFL